MASKELPSRNGVAAKNAVDAGVPSQTLYVTNLPEKMNKDELKRALYMLCSTYGPVLDIVTRRMNMRGQAHVVYRDIQTSTQAMRALQGFEFFGKEMKLVYAKGSSHIIAKLRGTFETSTASTTATESTELQKSIFNAPPPSIPSKPVDTKGGLLKPTAQETEQPPQGVKRPREEDDEDEKASESSDAMEEDEDDVAMEASSDED